MSIKKKIVLYLVVSITITSLIVLYATAAFHTQKKHGLYFEKINAITYQIANTLQNQEDLINKHLLAALKGVYSELEDGKIDVDRLEYLKQKYDVSNIYILDHAGYTTHTSDRELLLNETFLKTYSFFDKCPQERSILGTRDIFKKTPMIWIKELKVPFSWQ